MKIYIMNIVKIYLCKVINFEKPVLAIKNGTINNIFETFKIC